MHFTPKNTFYDIKPHHFKESTNIKLQKIKNASFLKIRKQNSYIPVTYKMKEALIVRLRVKQHTVTICQFNITHLIVVISALCP